MKPSDQRGFCGDKYCCRAAQQHLGTDPESLESVGDDTDDCGGDTQRDRHDEQITDHGRTAQYGNICEPGRSPKTLQGPGSAYAKRRQRRKPPEKTVSINGEKL